MRILFAVAPSVAHLFPMISTVWAARAAGHDVALTTSSAAVDGAVRAGLPVLDAAPDVDFGAIFGKSKGTAQDRAEQARRRGRAIAEAGGTTPDFVLERFATISDVMADETLAFARRWKPDLVVYSRLQGAGLLAARALDLPAVEHGFGFLREPTFPERYLPHLAPIFDRHDVPLELPPITPLHLAPPSMMIGAETGRTMRYVPYNAGGVLPPWFAHPATRPRIGVTLGTVVPQMSGYGSVESVLAAADGVDAEFVLALGDDPDLSGLAPLPDNVRLVGWVPLTNLLAHCDALIHHGGSGTTLTALCAGVPQIAMPHGADDFINADLVARHGIGYNLEPSQIDSRTLKALPHDPSLRQAAARVAAEIAHQPPPAALLPDLLDLAASARAPH
ncbi:nucleotide disphospho-sugar-binding domain-containing protein [Saccharomonospora saliphila]|uniref:nucleotide disphospho-sugar-binding domain-containing protein n=1 Tax=Saccharomonospora saliphila TaxID=369829 RepID=UPI00035FF67E|nr:nucleotide disphospho-sugar-binding domain-containing protein [Saccharomonospora saliphila]